MIVEIFALYSLIGCLFALFCFFFWTPDTEIPVQAFFCYRTDLALYTFSDHLEQIEVIPRDR